jgi:hypothetical protein
MTPIRNPLVWLKRLRPKRQWLERLMSSNEVECSDFYISPDGAQLAIPTGNKEKRRADQNSE